MGGRELGVGRVDAAVRGAVAVAAVVVATAALPATGLAAWSGPATLTARGEQAVLPTVAADRRGDVVVAWYRIRQGGDQAVARTSTNGGRSWRPLQVLGPAVVAISDNPPAPIRAAVAPNGEVAVTWGQAHGGGERVVAAVARHGASFGRARVLSGASRFAFQPDVAIDASGRAAVVWVTLSAVQRSLLFPGGRVTGPRVVANAASPNAPSVASDPSGDLLVAWTETTRRPPPRTPTFAARESARGAAIAPQQLASDGTDLPLAAMAPDGRGTVAWEQSSGVAQPVIKAVSAPWGSRFGAAQLLSSPGREAILGGGASGSRGVGVDDAGHVSVIWVEDPVFGVKGVSRVRVATSTNGRFGSFRTVEQLSGANTFERPAIGVAPAGCAIATWTELTSSGSGFVWGADSSRYGHPFGGGGRLSGANGDQSAVATVSADGDGVAVWAQGQFGGSVRAARWSTARW
jgi:hypothetical protein